MKSAIICPTIPPSRGGVGDHARILAEAITSVGQSCSIIDPFHLALSPKRLIKKIRSSNVNVVLMAYTPFLYGRLNLFTVLMMRKLKKEGIPSILFVHEIFIPSYSSFLRKIIYGLFNIWQDRQVVSLANHLIITSHYRKKVIYGLGYSNISLIPAYSNIPFVKHPDAAKKYLLCTFGTGHEDMVLGVAEKAVLLMGFGSTVNLGAKTADTKSFLKPEEISAILQESEFFVFINKRGISFRNGTAAAALQHGMVIIANRTNWTDPEFTHEKNIFFFDGSASGLAAAVHKLKNDNDLRKTISKNAKLLYDTLLAPEIAAKSVLNIFHELLNK